MIRFIPRSLYFLLLLPVLLCGCRGANSTTAAFDTDVYTPTEARGFSIKKSGQGESTLLTVSSPWQDAGDASYQLLVLRDGQSTPDGYDGAVVNGEARRIVAMSSTQVAMLEALGVADRLVGVSGIDFITTPSVRDRRDSIADVGYDTNIDYERLLMARPDLVLLYGVNGSNAMEPKLREMGIPYIYIGEYVEQSPLGKAEWLVALGELTGRRDKAIELYRSVSERYNTIKEKAAGLPRPRVMINAPYGDSWLMPSPDNYAARLIRDAGGQYVLADRKGSNATFPIDMEEAYLLASDADVWLNTGNASTREEFAAEVPRFVDTKPFVSGRLYNNTARRTPGGGNDFYETAVVEPDVLLADLVSILHPDALPDHRLKYYMEIK